MERPSAPEPGSGQEPRTPPVEAPRWVVGRDSSPTGEEVLDPSERLMSLGERGEHVAIAEQNPVGSRLKPPRRSMANPTALLSPNAGKPSEHSQRHTTGGSPEGRSCIAMRNNLLGFSAPQAETLTATRVATRRRPAPSAGVRPRPHTRMTCTDGRQWTPANTAPMTLSVSRDGRGHAPGARSHPPPTPAPPSGPVRHSRSIPAASDGHDAVTELLRMESGRGARPSDATRRRHR